MLFTKFLIVTLLLLSIAMPCYATPDTAIEYKCHLSIIDWLDGVFADGMVAGAGGPQAKQLEAIIISKAPPGLQYRTHVSCVGWQDWKDIGEMAGTTGQALGIEAIQFRFKNGATNLRIAGRVHVAYEGWHAADFAMYPNILGTVGKAHAIQAIQLIVIDMNTTPNDFISLQQSAPQMLPAVPTSLNQLSTSSEGAGAHEYTEKCWGEALDFVLQGTRCTASAGFTTAKCLGSDLVGCYKGVKGSAKLCTGAYTSGTKFTDCTEEENNKAKEERIQRERSIREPGGTADRPGKSNDVYRPSPLERRGF